MLWSFSQDRKPVKLFNFSFPIGIPDSQVPDLYKEKISYPEFYHSSSKVYPILKSLRVQNIGKEGTIQLGKRNTAAFNRALTSAKKGDTIRLIENESYTFLGGILAQYLDGITIDFAGYSRFIHSTEHWPYERESSQFWPAFHVKDCTNIVITSSATKKAVVSVDYEKNEIFLDPDGGAGGIIDGYGKKWWNDAIIGKIPVESRPRLIYIESSMNIVVEYLTLINSPYWTLTIETLGGEVRNVNVLIDRNYQRGLRNQTSILEEERPSDISPIRSLGRSKLRKFHFPDLIPQWILRPLSLNTDGIDPIGSNIWIHDCFVLNDDDSVAVKPPLDNTEGYVLNKTIPYKCTQDILIENMVLSGFGASVGSVGPSQYHPCVDRITFRNITMPGTGKGIYIKSNKSDCQGNISSQITNIL